MKYRHVKKLQIYCAVFQPIMTSTVTVDQNLFQLLTLVSVMKTDQIKALLFYIIWLNSPSCSCGKEKNSSFTSSFVCSCLTSSCWTVSSSAAVSVSLFQPFKKVRKPSVCCRKCEHRHCTVCLTGSIPSLLHRLGLSYISRWIPKTLVSFQSEQKTRWYVLNSSQWTEARQ